MKTLQAILILIKLLLVSSAFGEWGSLDSDSGLLLTPPQQYARQMEVPQSVRWDDPRIVRGDDLRTGAVIAIGGKPYIVSCAHDDGGFVRVGQVVNFQCNTGHFASARVVAVNPQADCSLFALDTNYRATPFTLADSSPQPGERVRQAGFPMGQQLRDRWTYVLKSSDNEIHIRAAAIPGDSGSPVVNERGELCGELYGGDIRGEGNQRIQGSLCCGVGPIRQMIASIVGSVSVQQTQCYNGRCYPPANGGWGPPPQPVQPVRPLPTPPPISNPPINNPPVVTQPPSTNPQPPAVSCDCGPKWTAINKVIAGLVVSMESQSEVNKANLEMIASMKAVIESQATAIANNNQNFNADVDKRITNYFTTNPATGTSEPSTLNFLGADNKVIATTTITPGQTGSVTLPPISFRVQDQRGAGYSTEYQPARLGSYVTLPFGEAQQ